MRNTLRVAKIDALDIQAKVQVRGWLISNGKTQTWLAAQVGVSEPILSKILSGHHSIADDVAKAIKKITGVDVRRFKKVAA